MHSESDVRIHRGMRRQLAERERLRAAGVRPVGWKAGFGSPAAMAAIGTAAPLVGFVTERSLVPDGGVVAVGGWAEPRIEVELAARIGTDVPGTAGRAAAAAAIAALAPALELVDLDGPRGPGDVEDVLAGNVFHRHVVLGAFAPERAGGDTAGIRIAVAEGEHAHAGAVDPAATVGDLAEVVRSVAATLAAAGERLRAGDIVMTGAATPVVAAVPGARLTARFAGLGDVAVELR